MARKANDGTEYTNQMSVNRHNARMDAKSPKAAPTPAADPQSAQDGGGGGDIMSDPEAMQAIDLLKQKGYTAQDVEKAMDDGSGDSQAADDQGQSSAQSAPLQIPGLS
jgi:hypothetical protein